MGEPLEHEVLVTVAAATPLPNIAHFEIVGGRVVGVADEPHGSCSWPVPNGATRLLYVSAAPAVQPGSTISIGLAPGRLPDQPKHG